MATNVYQRAVAGKIKSPESNLQLWAEPAWPFYIHITTENMRKHQKSFKKKG